MLTATLTHMVLQIGQIVFVAKRQLPGEKAGDEMTLADSLSGEADILREKYQHAGFDGARREIPQCDPQAAFRKIKKHTTAFVHTRNIRAVRQTILSKQRAFIRRIIYAARVIFFIVQRHK